MSRFQVQLAPLKSLFLGLTFHQMSVVLFRENIRVSTRTLTSDLRGVFTTNACSKASPTDLTPIGVTWCVSHRLFFFNFL